MIDRFIAYGHPCKSFDAKTAEQASWGFRFANREEPAGVVDTDRRLSPAEAAILLRHAFRRAREGSPHG